MTQQRILRLPEVSHITGLKAAAIYRLAAKNEFPSPIKIGQRSSGWVEEEVQAWINDRIEASRAKGGVAHA